MAEQDDADMREQLARPFFKVISDWRKLGIHPNAILQSLAGVVGITIVAYGENGRDSENVAAFTDNLNKAVSAERNYKETP